MFDRAYSREAKSLNEVLYFLNQVIVHDNQCAFGLKCDLEVINLDNLINVSNTRMGFISEIFQY